jgi:hypothetical protein
MSETREIFIIGSYAKTPKDLEILADMVHHLAALDRHICLVSHLPIPHDLIHKNVKYVIYDSNNILIPVPITVMFRFQDFEIRFRPSDFYHGAAIYGNLFNALRLLSSRYEWAHFIESDLDPTNVENYLASAFPECQTDKDVKVIGYVFPQATSQAGFPAIVTNIFSIKPDTAPLLPCLSRWEDYCKFYFPPQSPIFERWLMDRFRDQNIKCKLLPPPKLQNRSNQGGNHVVIKCRLYNPQFFVFIINRSEKELEAKARSGTVFRLPPGGIGLLPDASSSEEVTVTYAGDTTIYRHPLETMILGAFRKAGADLCPDWK